MGRVVKRVEIDFEWPMNVVWQGFINPHYDECTTCSHCDGMGYSAFGRKFHERWHGSVPFRPEDNGSTPIPFSHPEIMAFATRQILRSPEYYGSGDSAVNREAKRLAELYNARMECHLNQRDLDILLSDPDGLGSCFTHARDENGEMAPRTALQKLTLEEYQSIVIGSLMARVNYSPILAARANERGESEFCLECAGNGSVWSSDEARIRSNEWKQEEPPEGEGWQLWETVSEGSPVSPVFSTPEALAAWLTGRPGINSGTTEDQWLKFITGPGWAPSFVMAGGQAMSGVEVMVK